MVGTLPLNFKQWYSVGAQGWISLHDRYADKGRYVSVKSRVQYTELGYAI